MDLRLPAQCTPIKFHPSVPVRALSAACSLARFGKKDVLMKTLFMRLVKGL